MREKTYHLYLNEEERSRVIWLKADTPTLLVKSS